MATLKYDRVILTKELNERFRKVGEIFEIANILDDSILLRDSKTRAALGIISFEELEQYFVHEPNHKGWTQWIPLTGFDGQSDAYYRTNRRKVQVKFLTDKIRAEACCNRVDDFNLSFGIQMAYLRCLNKAWTKKKNEYEEELKRINLEIADNEKIIKRMINSLRA